MESLHPDPKITKFELCSKIHSFVMKEWTTFHCVNEKERELDLASSDSFGRGKPTFFHPVVLIFGMSDPKGCPD